MSGHDIDFRKLRHKPAQFSGVVTKALDALKSGLPDKRCPEDEETMSAFQISFFIF